MLRPPLVHSLAIHAAGAALAAAVGLAALTPAAARAQAGTLTFNALTDVDGSGVRYVANCYEEAGIRVTAVGLACGAPDALGTWTPDNAAFYTGSAALWSATQPSVDFTAVGGGTFSFQSVGLTSLQGLFGAPTSVLFTGMLASGMMVSESVLVPGGTTAMSMFSFTGFTNLSSLRLTVTAPTFEPYVQFDNMAVVVTPNVIPEPATVVLLGAGVAGLAVVARRRRNAPRAQRTSN